MTAAHLGPAPARVGGPAGYLWQLQRALDTYGTGDNVILLPSTASPDPASQPTPGRSDVLDWLRRARRHLLGPPHFYRESEEALNQTNGPLHVHISAAWDALATEAHSAFQALGASKAEVLFTHDAAGAEFALEHRRPGQQVWLFVHAPFPFALFLAWCWGVPQRAWQEVRAFPDVRTWMSREAAVMGAVDRIVVPCAEAVDEWRRVDERYASLLSRAEFVLTGAQAASRRHCESRTELRKRWKLPDTERVGLFLGNDQPYRGCDTLMAALDHLPSRSELPGVVAVAGVSPEQLPLKSRVRALGGVSDVGDLLAAVDFVINVNRFSLFDLSTIEALEAGRPVLMHATGGNRTFHMLGAGAVMLQDLAPRTVADGLARMFAFDSSELESLGGQSRSCYDAHLTPRHLRDRHVECHIPTC